ncbi:hypothetical protein [Paenibacillus mucilaginosus]|uniref:DUF4352 domain-containing protein n=1 Tax=Paenibacillus mucilaginosus (strain KNP414) TaxID=1036673 RepID=F8FBG6_PAEMK|nr:hypothetical protein [Paenibacillus mucilaginosus]AEI42533.1 hypothetical protein KNP414_03999 [Paenibacillus mucilaginosus KNP414]MCG7213926.1 hypothetical protein [Paenibacillus mucilaginosus]WDM25931.1 hypothetical protein KCX80_26310 [Paenibacillus mucilaginosus]
MNRKLKMTVASVILSASLVTPGYAALAAEAPAAETAVPAVVSYKLTDLLDFEVKAVLNEKVDEGTRLGVVVRLKNNSSSVTRVPDYELRVKSSDGTVYTLQPSAGSPKSIQPKATTEVGYISVVDRTDEITLTEVNWTDVDVYVYPKTETVIVAAPITGTVWQGSESLITDPKAVKKWSDAFVLPTLTSPIQYTPVNIKKESTQNGTVFVVQLLAYNPSAKKEEIPAFVIDGRNEEKVFAGSRVEQGALSLQPKEEKYIHFAIPTDQDTVLTSLNVLTEEQFGGAAAGSAGDSSAASAASAAGSSAGTAAGAGSTDAAAAGGGDAGAASAMSAVNTARSGYYVGRLNILLPAGPTDTRVVPYNLGDVMQFDKRSELIPAELDVSVAQFDMYENTEEGAKTVTAKFKLYNKSDKPVAVPTFQADLVSSDGYEYTGARQKISTAQILPKSAITVSYSYAVPVSEPGTGLGVKVQDTKLAAPYKTTIAAYKLPLQPSGDINQTIAAYPFEIKLKSLNLSYTFSAEGYVYSAKPNVELKRQDLVQLDASSTGLLFELYDNLGSFIGSATKPFVGEGRLLPGENKLTFSGVSQQGSFPLIVKVYETFTTENGGVAKRLVGVHKQ